MGRRSYNPTVPFYRLIEMQGKLQESALPYQSKYWLNEM
jgi:hypothetical protein